jgi:hypothetical protein
MTQFVMNRANFMYRSYRYRKRFSVEDDGEMRLQVTERIVLIYSDVSVLGIGDYRYRIRRECNCETSLRMRGGAEGARLWRRGGIEGGSKRGSRDGGDGSSARRSHV